MVKITPPTMLLAAAAAVTLTAGTIGLTQTATATTATTSPTVSSERELLEDFVKPYQPGGPGTPIFYSPGDTAKLWTRHIATIDAPLPPGVQFPLTLKQFAEPDNGEIHWIQDGMVPQLAGIYWRCAWEDLAIQAHKNADAAGYLDASHTASTWLTLPGLEPFADNRKKAEEQTRAEAKNQGVLFEELNFSLGCQIYVGEKSK